MTYAANTWADGGGRAWVDYGGIQVDDVSVLDTSQELTVDRRLVYAGELTDAKAQADDRGVAVSAQAVDFASNLSNLKIGSEPWLLEPLNDRAHRIMGIANVPVTLGVDEPIRSLRISWRDVDSQPVLGLLQDLAQSAGAVLWATGNKTTGPFLWIEDQLNSREASREWAMGDDGYATITGTSRSFLPLSACDLLRDPLQWEQSVSNVVTRVDVTWREQTLDEEGNQQPTDRVVTVADQPEPRAEWGERELAVSTELAYVSDAQSVGARYLALRRSRTWRISGATIDTHIMRPGRSGASDATRSRMLMMLLDQIARIGAGIIVTDLPAYAPDGGQPLPCYVDGGTYTFERGAWTLDLNITPAGAFSGSSTWSDLELVAWRWNQISREVTWTDAYGVAAPT